jgi:hypothetical protein
MIRSDRTAATWAASLSMSGVCLARAGGAYFLCAEQNGRRPVVFASSEGEGGLLADDLADALEIIIGLEWRDCLTFSGGGDVAIMQISARHLEIPRRSPPVTHPRQA